MAKNPPPRTRGVVAYTKSGKRVVLAGPPKPIPVGGGKYANPQFQYSGQTLPDKPAPRSKRPAPPPKKTAPRRPRISAAGVPGASKPGDRGPLEWPFSQKGRSVIRAGLLQDSLRIDRQFPDLPKVWRDSLKEASARAYVEKTIREKYYDSPTAYVGRTISNAADFGEKVVLGLPQAMARGVVLTGRAAQALGMVPTSLDTKKEAAGELAGEARAQLGYYGTLGKQFIKDPAETIEKRGAEVLLALGLGWSAAGQGSAAAARASAQAARFGRATRQAGSLRGGVRVYRGENRALTMEQLRDLQLRDLAFTASRSNRHAAPSFGARTGRYVFRAADDVNDAAARAAEITGNAVMGPVGRALGRMGDWGSRSTLVGAPRYREPKVATDLRSQQATNASGQTAVPPGEILVPQRPRSSNPLSRGIQRTLLEPLGRNSRAAIDRKLARSMYLSNLFSSFAVAASRGGRNLGYEVPNQTDAGIYNEARVLAKMVGKLKGAGRSGQLPQSEVARGTQAAIIRAMGIAEEFDGGRTWGRDELVSRLNGFLENPTRRVGRRDRKRLVQNLETLKSIPDEWLDPTTSPKWLNDLEGEVRRVLARSSQVKRDMGVITPGAAEWGGRRAQAQFGFQGRSLKNLKGAVYAGPKQDAQRASRMRAEIRARAKNKTAYDDLGQYSTQALDTMATNLERRARTIRGRVKPFIRAAEADAFSAFDEEMQFRGAVDDALSRVRDLESRPPTAALRDEIREARAEYNRLVAFQRERARARQTMADQGARAMDAARARRDAVREAARRQDERVEAEFERDRAAARLRMARQGRVAMGRAEIGRARREVRGARRAERQEAPRVEVALGRAAAAGERKGRAQARTSPNPDGPPTAGRSRALGTMLRSDAGLYVARQQQGRARAVRRSEVEPAIRREGEARRSRRNLSEAEIRAMRELEQARAQLNALRSRPRNPRRPAKETPAQRRARRDVQRATVSTRRGVPEDALPLYERIKQLQAALAAMRASRNGTPAQIAGARKALNDARRALVTARRRYGRFAYTGSTGPARAGMAPGEYYPQQSPIRGDQDTRFNTEVLGSVARVDNAALSEVGARAGANLTPRQEKFNAAVLAEDGLILLSPRVVIDALRSALDVKVRSEMASAFVTKYAYKANGRVLSGDAARRFVDQNPDTYMLITERNLARISSLSSDSVAGRELIEMLDQIGGVMTDRVVAVPTAAVRGWRTALDPGGKGGRIVDYLNSLWKGGVLALSPRWYVQNFFGMWGQFALGAGLDLQAINMARNPKYLELLPGRISQMGLSQEFGEFARRAQGDAVNVLGSIIRWGYHANAALESVPRRALYWHASKKGLTQSQLMPNGVMDDGLLAAAWLDVARAAGRNDPGAQSIVDQALVETERFMGNYSTYNWLERRILRRIFPFYGWMRAINRLAFALPVKHPKRAALLASASYMAYDERNDVSGYQKGLWVGDYLFGMMTFNALASTLPTFAAANAAGQNLETEGLSVNTIANLIIDAGKAALEQAGPLPGETFRALSGSSLSGMPASFPENYQGFRTQPGIGEMVRTNPQTGEREYGPPSIPVLRQVEGMVPYTGVARTLLARGRQTYSNVGLFDLLQYRAKQGLGLATPYDASRIFQRDNENRYTQRPWWGELTNIGGGVPVMRVDTKRLKRYQQSRTEQYIKGLASSRKRERTIQEQALRGGW